MEETEIAALKTEIVRLNKLIGILIEQNEAIKADIAFRKVTNPSEDIPIAIRKITNGNTESQDGIHNSTKGNPEVPNDIRKVTNGNTESPEAIRKITNGNTDNLHQLPRNIPLNDGNLKCLYNTLKQEGFNKVHKSAIMNAAKLLLHFHNKGRGDYIELRKLTGMSKYGLAKYIRSLKKRGLIQRDGWQKFVLTSNAYELIAKAGCKE